jgi:nucleotide-binding universal stress UspA family protein
MSIASILIHVDNNTACKSRLETAIRLAQQFDAHLTALYVILPTNFPIFSQIPVGPKFIKSHRKSLWEGAARAQKDCEDAARDVGVTLEWRAEEGILIDTLNEHGRYCDLIVLGQYDPSDRNDLSEGAADHVILESGTACLVVPYIGIAANNMNNILIAWNGSMESSRAVKDAVPILKQAKRVEVLVINPEQRKVDEGDVTGAKASAYLARHGINVEAHTVHNKQSNAGDVLLSHASDFSADLVVMGAYGHTRLREKVLGGVTKHLLEHMTVPVLMSH